MVTGAIGKTIARPLADIVVLVCRDIRKAEQAVNEIIEITGKIPMSFDIADLRRNKDIRESVGYSLPTNLARQ